MKGIYIVALLLTLTFFSNCGKIELPTEDKVSNKPSKDENPTSKVDTFTVGQALELEEDKSIYIVGYIVGYINGNKISNAVFSLPNNDITNFIIADEKDEENTDLCMAISLNKSAIYHKELSIFLHPDNYKKRICLFGNTITYFGKIGLKKILKYNWQNDFSISQDGTSTPTIDNTETLIPNGRKIK